MVLTQVGNMLSSLQQGDDFLEKSLKECGKSRTLRGHHYSCSLQKGVTLKLRGHHYSCSLQKGVTLKFCLGDNRMSADPC
jgi:hypothetical protein